MQLVGRIVGGALAVGAIGYAGTTGFEDNTTRDASGAITESGGLGVFELRVGDCVNMPAVGEYYESLEGVPCSDMHDREVYHLFDVPGADWPGDAAVSASANNGCYDAFEPYVGRAYERSDLDIGLLTPTAETWAEGDREVVCMAFQMDGLQLQSTVRNSRR